MLPELVVLYKHRVSRGRRKGSSTLAAKAPRSFAENYWLGTGLEKPGSRRAPSGRHATTLPVSPPLSQDVIFCFTVTSRSRSDMGYSLRRGVLWCGVLKRSVTTVTKSVDSLEQLRGVSAPFEIPPQSRGHTVARHWNQSYLSSCRRIEWITTVARVVPGQRAPQDGGLLY